MQHQFKQSLSLTDATLIVAGSMIGSGIFIVSADISRTLGSSGWMLATWILAGLLTVAAALSYGELAGMFPKAGGQYVYLREAYNPFIAFIYGWTVFTVIQSGAIAAVAVAFAKFASYFFPFFSEKNILFHINFLNFSFSGAKLLAIASLIIITLINLNGIDTGKWVQRVFTFTKIFAIFIIIILGLTISFNKEIFSQNWTNPFLAMQKDALGQSFQISGMALFAAFGTAMVGSLFSSDAWNNVTFIAGEIKNPMKNIPLSLLLGTLIVSIIYILTNIAYTALLPLQGSVGYGNVLYQGIQHAEADRVGSAAASVIFGNYGGAIMALLIIISTFGCNNGLIISGSRLYYAMALDGLFFKEAAILNPKGVPKFAMIAQLIWCSILCLSGSYNALLTYTIFAALLFYILTIAGVFILRVKQPEIPRPYKVWAYPFMPIIYIVIALIITLILFIYKPENTIPGIAIVLAGIPVYYILHNNKK